MPIYEYECCGCKSQFQNLVMKKEDEGGIACPGCGSHNIKRLISKVAYHQSEYDRLDSYNPQARQSDGFYKDTRNIGLHAEKQAKELGVDLGSSFKTKLDKLRTDPSSVLKDTE